MTSTLQDTLNMYNFSLFVIVFMHHLFLSEKLLT